MVASQACSLGWANGRAYSPDALEVITVWLLAFPKSFLNVGLFPKSVPNGAIANCKMNIADWLLQSPNGRLLERSQRTAVQWKNGKYRKGTPIKGYRHRKSSRIRAAGTVISPAQAIGLGLSQPPIASGPQARQFVIRYKTSGLRP